MKTWTSERLVTKLTHPPPLSLISSLIASLICPAHQFPVTQFIFRPMIQIKYFYWTTWPNEQKHCKFPGNVPIARRQCSTAGVSFLPWHQMFLTEWLYMCVYWYAHRTFFEFFVKYSNQENLNIIRYFKRHFSHELEAEIITATADDVLGGNFPWKWSISRFEDDDMSHRQDLRAIWTNQLEDINF